VINDQDTNSTVYMPDKYLTCMWSSVRSYGVEVDIFEPAHLIAKLKAGQKVGT